MSAIAEERRIVAAPAAPAWLPRRLYAWMEERFPVANGILAGVVWISVTTSKAGMR